MGECEDCKYAIWDYEQYYPAGKEYFVSGCRLGNDEEDCEDFDEYLPPLRMDFRGW